MYAPAFEELGIRDYAALGRLYAARAGLGQNFTDLGPLLGPDARGLSALGAVFHPGEATGMIMEHLPGILQKELKAEVFLTTSHNSWHENTERVYAYKPGFWVCGVFMNYRERIATIVTLGGNNAFSQQGIVVVAEKLEMSGKGERINGLEEMLADRARDIILAVPKMHRFRVLG